MPLPSRPHHRLTLLSLAPAIVLAAYAAGVHAQTVVRDFDLPGQPLGPALAELARQAGLQLMVEEQTLAGRQAPAVSGRLTPQQALNQLLAGSGLDASIEGGFAVVRRVPAAAATLGEVRVSGERDLKDEAYSTPASVAVITREDMDKLVMRNTGDALEGTPGVFVKNQRSSPGLAVNIRGLEGQQRITITIDGARQNFQKSGHGIEGGEVYLDSELLAGVDVTKGVTSGVGGAGAIGGVVNFRTLDAGDLLAKDAKTGGRINLTTGSNAYHFQGSAAAAQRFGTGLDVVGAISRRNIGAYKMGTRDNGIGAFQRGTTTMQARQSSLSGLFKTTWRLSDEQALKFGYVGYDTDGVEADGGDVSSDGWTVRTHTVNLAHSYKPAANPLLDLASQLYYTRTSYDQRYGVSEGGTTGITDIRYQTETVGGSLSNTSLWDLQAVALKLNYGGEFFHDWTSPGASSSGDGDATWYTGPTPEGKRTVASGFMEATAAHASGFEAIAGLRYDWYQLSGGGQYQTCYVDPQGLPQARTCYRTNEPGVRPQYTAYYTNFHVKRHESQFSPKFTLAYTPKAWQPLQLFASYGKGMRPPGITETLFHGRHVGDSLPFIPNPGLRAETSRNLELGFNLKLASLLRQDDRLRLKTAFFDTRVKNYIGQLPVMGVATVNPSPMGSAWGHVNIDRPMRYRGWELSLDYDAGDFFGDLTWTRIYNRTGAYSYDPFPLGSLVGYPPTPYGGDGYAWSPTNLPARSGALGLGVRLFERRLTLGARARYQRYDNSTMGTAFGAGLTNWTVYDLWASWKATPALDLRLAVNNVRDLRYGELSASGSSRRIAPGRTALVTASLKF